MGRTFSRVGYFILKPTQCSSCMDDGTLVLSEKRRYSLLVKHDSQLSITSSCERVSGGWEWVEGWDLVNP